MSECDFDTLAAMLDEDSEDTATGQTSQSPADTAASQYPADSDSSDDDISDGELDRLASLVEDEANEGSNTSEKQTPSPQQLPSGADKSQSSPEKSKTGSEDDELAMLYARIKELEAKKKSGSSSSSDENTTSGSTPTNTGTEIKAKKPALKEISEDIFGVESESTPSKVTPPATKKPAPVSEQKRQTSTSSQRNQTVAGEDSDSDWEGLEGDKPSSLSQPGRELSGLLKKSSQRVAHQPRTDSPAHKPDQLRKTATAPQRSSTAHIAQSAGIPESVLRAQKQSKMSANTKEENIQVEARSKLRIINPRVSSHVLSSLMEGRTYIATSRLQQKLSSTADIEGDWVTMAVVTYKSQSRKSAKGDDFIFWRLCDLADCDKVVVCFLFNSAYKQHWKTSVGSVVGLLNPTVKPNTEKYQNNSSDSAISVDNDKKILLLGQSRDFKMCRAKTKAGADCSSFVNLQKGEYCTYHVQSAYKKQSAQRAELQAGFSGVTPKSYVKKIFPTSNVTVNYGGQMYTSASQTPKSSKKKSSGVNLKSVQEHHHRKVAGGDRKVTTLALHDLLPEDKVMVAQMKSAATKTSQDKHSGFYDLLSKPTPGSVQFVKHLQIQENKPVDVAPEKKSSSAPLVSVSASDLLKQHKAQMASRLPSQTPSPARLPQLGRGLAPGDDIFFDDDKTSKDRKANMAKAKALAKIQSRGGIEKDDPNAVKKKKKAADAERIRKRVAEDDVERHSEKVDSPPRKRSRLAGNLDLDSDQVKKLLSAVSAHDNTLTEEEAAKMENYFGILEKKEKMEEKMDSITEMKVKAVRCLKCDYTALGASQNCKENQHPLKYFTTNKRFFKCKDCGKRTVTIEKIPVTACTKCGGMNYARTSMLQEKKGPTLPHEELKLRGDEIKNLNSL